MEPADWAKAVSAGIVATALGTPVGDVLKWLLWKLIAMVREWVVLRWGHVGAPLNAIPDVQTSESNANGDARADVIDHSDTESGAMTILDVNDHIDPESDEIANVANGGEPSLEDHAGNDYDNSS